MSETWANSILLCLWGTHRFADAAVRSRHRLGTVQRLAVIGNRVRGRGGRAIVIVVALHLLGAEELAETLWPLDLHVRVSGVQILLLRFVVLLSVKRHV